MTRTGQPDLKIAIGIATVGRPEVLERVVGLLSRQTRPADAILVCSPDRSDLDRIETAFPHVRTVVGERGLPRQRNRLLKEASDADIILFIDDDFLLAPDYLQAIESVFVQHPDIAMVTGRVLADGIKGPGFSVEEGLGYLGAAAPSEGAALRDVYNGYGCNMAVRMRPVIQHSLRFDESLPLYGWLEDVDFSRAVAPFGRIVKSRDAAGVHLGVKSARQPGTRLGYSQVANPIYLMLKGTCSWPKGLMQIGRNLVANVYGTIRGETAVDRSGRLSGNARAISDLFRLRLNPSRILAM
ncbi:glycosyltransferase [Fulvimarina sp. MAC3]|uniref:glycosyltransferase family 2 protein n=1 Tax=Fulvimarina sp. MAC3 TaxID=3148887 RepID=UPI0031FC3A0B